MAPIRSSKHSTPQPSSSKTQTEIKHKSKHKIQTASQNTESDVAPGVQKVKAALRSTRRLLAKDKIAADVRVNAERRLKALEAQLVEAEIAKKERALATRYHKIKFFEHQKVTRKIKKVKQQLEDCDDKKERKRLEKSLAELRVDFNYIHHYPKLKKYISLFPPEEREGAKDDKDEGEEADPQSSQTDSQRDEIRQDIRERMATGELSAEPELGDRHARTSKRAARASGDNAKSSGPQYVPNIKEDEFFGEESDEAEADTDSESAESEDDRMDQS